MNKLVLFLVFFLTAGSILAQTKKPAVKPKTPVAAAASPLKAALVRGKVVYTTYCLACHQADGGGVPNMNPPLSKTVYVNGDKTRLINILLKGLNSGITINGDTYSNPMPQFDYLKDQEIADVLTYVRNNFGNKSTIILAANVKVTRK